MPERVSVALAGLTGELREGLLALAVGAGMHVLAAMMEDDVTPACGLRGKHDPQRAATRHRRELGSVALGGRRVPIERPRMRAVDGSGELAVASYEVFSSTEVLGRMALEPSRAPPTGTPRSPASRCCARASRRWPPRSAPRTARR